MKQKEPGRTSPPRRVRWTSFDPEAVLLLLLGLVTFFYGTQALLRWALAGWQSGRALAPLVMLAVATILPALFLLFIRRRWLALTVGMFWLGAVAYCLATLGFSPPAACARSKAVAGRADQASGAASEANQASMSSHIGSAPRRK